MRNEELSAVARLVRGFGRTDKTTSDRSVPMTAVGALVAGMLLSAGFLAVTESRAPAVQNEAWDEQDADIALEAQDALSDNVAFRSEPEVVPTQRSAPSTQHPSVRWFNDRPIRPVKTVTMLVTAYSPDERSCGKWADGITASGYSVWTNGMKLVAADTSILPFGSLVSVPGYDGDEVVPVLDRGGAIKGNRLDVLYPTHESALEWGAQRLEVTLWEYADGKPNDFRQQHRR